jgi:hypothetical protein
MSSSSGVILPQGPLVTGDIVTLATNSVDNQPYVYAQDNQSASFQPWNPTSSTNPTPIQFRISVNTAYVTLVAVTPIAGGLAYDTSGKAMISPFSIALPIHLNQIGYTDLEPPASVIASVLYVPNTSADTDLGVALVFPVLDDSGITYQRIMVALVPVRFYTRNGSCTAVTNPTVGLNLFTRSYFTGITVPMGTPNSAWTTLQLCSRNITFELCPSGTYCNGRCYSTCQEAGKVCVAQNGIHRCVTTAATTTSTTRPTSDHHTTTTTNNLIPSNIYVHHEFTGTAPNVIGGVIATPPILESDPGSGSGNWWVWLIFGIFLFLLALMILYFMFWSGTTSTSSYHHVHQNSQAMYAGTPYM